MKILYVHTTPLNSRQANLLQVTHMVNAFTEIGHEVTLLIPGPEGEILRLNKQVDVRFYKRVINSRSTEFLNVFRIGKIIKQVNPDLCYTRTIWPLICLLIIGQQIVFESHDIVLHQGNRFLDWLYKKIILFASRKKKILLFVAISRNLLNDWILTGMNEKLGYVAHDGYDRNLFVDYNIKKVKEDWGFKKSNLIVTYTGSLYPDREIETILKLARKFPQLSFVVAGGPETQKQHYLYLSKGMGLQNIFFLGHIDHARVPSLLAASDILLALWSEKVPTIKYCSPLKLFEYMASGKIIVAHGFPTIKEVLIDNHSGLLVKPGDFNELVEKLSLAVRLFPGEEIAIQARLDANLKYSWQTRAQNIIDQIFDQKSIA